MLLLIPQRYEFSSKSQQWIGYFCTTPSCCWYHKGTNFQANHNRFLPWPPFGWVVVDTTKVRIFKQITTCWCWLSSECTLLLIPQRYEFSSKSQRNMVICFPLHSCCWYHKGTNFQANHNCHGYVIGMSAVVVDTTKVRIFKQITTKLKQELDNLQLLLIPQRYEFSSKSQPFTEQWFFIFSCCWYHKGTNFQANHNENWKSLDYTCVVVDTTKVRIFKQITTTRPVNISAAGLLLIPQRYEFSSKSQQWFGYFRSTPGCCWYHKGTNFQANHNQSSTSNAASTVVVDTTKVRIFKQITTRCKYCACRC